MRVKYVADSFENGVLNRRIGKDKQIEPHQVSFSTDSADGDQSIVITPVASAGIDPKRLMEFQNLIAEISSDPELGMLAVNAERALADLKALKRHQGARHINI